MIGCTVSHYRINEKLGGGGMGVVYKAEDLSLRRMVALKFLPPEMTRDPEAKQRFVEEAQAASSIDHPNICTIHEIGDAPDGQMFIAMSFYSGGSLKQRIGGRPMSVAEAIRVSREAAQGLARAHATGIVHRDVKPANIVLTDEGAVKIVDFGLAKLAGQSHLTGTGTTAGTVAYMSPEQARGEDVDARTDIWSLGVVLHEMLTGEAPFRSDREQAVVYRILNAEPEKITAIRRDVPVELERIVEHAMEKRPERRYASMSNVVDDLRKVSERLASGGMRRRRLPLWLRRRNVRRAAAVAAVAIAVLAAGGIFAWRLRAAAGAPVSIAVIPLRNMSGDASQDWFANAVTESLYTDLLKDGRLRVVSPDLARSAADSAGTMAELARSLRVTWVVTGSVVRDKLTNTVQVFIWLVNGPRDENVWSEKYTRDFNDVFTVQSDITRAITSAVHDELPAGQLQPVQQALKPEAVEACLLGRHHATKLTQEALTLSIGYFEKALDLEPDYALALAGLANACLLRAGPWAGSSEPRQSAERATMAARQALRVDRTLAEAHRVLGQVKRDYDWDFPAADDEFALALKGGAGDPSTLAEVARLRLLQGGAAEALDLALRAQSLDVLDPGISTTVATAYAAMGRYPQSLAELQEVLVISPSYAPAYATRGSIQVKMRMWPDAVASYEEALTLAPGNPILEARLAFALARAGRGADARRIRSDLAARDGEGYVPPIAFAFIAAGFGETAPALDWLEKAVQERSPLVPEIPLEGVWDDIREDARLKALLATARLNQP